MSALKQTLRSRILKIAFVKDLRVLFKMAFTTHLNGNIGACALSMALLNYNCAITSYVLMLRDQFSAIDSVTYTLAAISILVGLVIGQLMFGMFGDVLGRRKSFFGSAILMLSGSILSIFSGYLFLGTDWTMIEFSICRIILGVGAGGMYPIVAAITRESSQEEIANTTVALVFGPFGSAGIIFAPIIVYMITIIPFFNNDTRWRLLLAVGAMSTIFLMFMEVEETLDRRPGQGQPKYPILERDAHETVLRLHRFGAAVRKLWDELFLALKTPIMREYLIGTSLSWFFSDILHYGNILMLAKFFDQLVHETAYDDDMTFSMDSLAIMGLVSNICFWVGGVASIVALRKISALALQLQGFALTAAAFFLVSFCKATLPNRLWPVTIAVYASTFFFAGMGPSPCTFLIPSLLFPSSIRTTANGVAAAVGKIGAILGLAFSAYVGLEISNLMACFGAVALVGAGSTLYLIRTYFKVSARVNGSSRASVKKKDSAGGSSYGSRSRGANSLSKDYQNLDSLPEDPDREGLMTSVHPMRVESSDSDGFSKSSQLGDALP